MQVLETNFQEDPLFGQFTTQDEIAMLHTPDYLFAATVMDTMSGRVVDNPVARSLSMTPDSLPGSRQEVYELLWDTAYRFGHDSFLTREVLDVAGFMMRTDVLMDFLGEAAVARGEQNTFPEGRHIDVLSERYQRLIDKNLMQLMHSVSTNGDRSPSPAYGATIPSRLRSIVMLPIRLFSTQN